MDDTLQKVLDGTACTAEEAFAAFDKLEAMTIDDMMGRWTLHEVNTGHLIGWAARTGWSARKDILWCGRGASFGVHHSADKTELYAVNPKLVPLEADLPKEDIVGTVIETARFLMETKDSKARLRMVEFRGRVTACMLYDDRPIIDAFVKH